MIDRKSKGKIKIRSACYAFATVATVMLVVPSQAWGAGGSVGINLLSGAPDHIVVEYEPGAYTQETVLIDGEKYLEFAFAKESKLMDKGAPGLPRICRSFIIPDDAKMEVNVLDASFYEIHNVLVAPSKGIIYRNTNPQDVPYEFGEVYQVNGFYPAEIAVLRDAYIMRDYRGIVAQFHPMQYNPVSGTLRVYTYVKLEITQVGPGEINVFHRPPQPKQLSLAFHELYLLHFLNYEEIQQRYEPLDETGDMLIICHDPWLANVQPLVDHKSARGIDTTAVGVSTIGNDAVSIKNYIQSVYDSSDLAFVLLVGDAAQVDTPFASGGSSDPSYSKLAGGDDYPDIMVGRFSAETSDQTDTQVERTIEYEQMPATSQDWFWKGTGIASNQGPGDNGEYDNEHMDVIRDKLLLYGYTEVDQIYDPSGTAAQVAAALNEGRGIVNYCGHGSTTSWGSTGFNNNDVNNLVNDNMLPFISSVACVNGQFDGYTCFAEAWLRATHNGEPTGAVGAYMSSVNQSWNPPMRGQDVFIDEYVAETYSSLGTLLYAGSCGMMDYYGAGGVEMFDTWHLFGDPSLKVVVSCSDAGTIALDSNLYACEDTAAIFVVDCGLNLDDGTTDTVDITIASTSEPTGETVTLSEIDPASGQFSGSITLSETDSAGVLLVAPGDTVTVTYIDADDGQGGTDIEVTDTALVDCTPPSIWNIQTAEVEPHSALITFEADEPVQGTVHYGLSCDALTGAATGSGYSTTPQVNVSGLDDNTTYFYAVEAADEAGNSVTDDN
ncbi:MAG: hypothetical protein JSV78_03330, partial [Phycisphaerales bacterium]